MAGDGFDVWTFISGVPGVAALIGAAVGYGKLTQRINDVEKALDGEGGLIASLHRLSLQTARIDERGLANAKTLENIDKKLDRALDKMSDAASVATVRYSERK